MEQQPFMSPHRVMSLVVFALSVLMIMGIASLKYMQTNLDNNSAVIFSASESRIQQLRALRQLAAQNQEESDDSQDEEVIDEE
jgi:hypothetical protein